MRKEIDGPILDAFATAVTAESAPDNSDVQLLVTFKLGDLRRLKRNREHMETVTKPALGA